MPALLFYKGTGLAAWIIRKWTRTRFAYVAPCTIESKIYDAHWPAGVTVRPYDALKDWDASIAVSVTPAVPVGWLNAQVGKRCDIAALVFCGLCKRFPGLRQPCDCKRDAWTCSRLACVWAGLEIKARGRLSLLTPQDLYESLTEADHCCQSPSPAELSSTLVRMG